MAVRGVDEPQGIGTRQQCRQLLLLGSRVQPVRVDAHDQRGHVRPAQRTGGPAPAAADVVPVHRLGERHIAARVEPAHQLLRVVVEIRLHPVAPAASRLLARLRLTAETGAQLGLAAVRDVGDAARLAEAPVRTAAGRGAVVVAAPPPRVRADGADLNRAPGDLLGGRGGRGGEHQQRTGALRPAHRPLQGPHTAHRAPDHGRPPGDAQHIGQRRLGRHLVPYRQIREPGAPGCSVGPRGRGARTALAAAQDVRGDDEPPVGVQRPARSDQRVPPAGGGVAGTCRSGRMAVARQRVQDQHGVGTVRRPLPPGLVRQAHPR